MIRMPEIVSNVNVKGVRNVCVVVETYGTRLTSYYPTWALSKGTGTHNTKHTTTWRMLTSFI